MIDENQRNIMPFYLLVDESGSMSGSPVDAVNEGLMTIWREIVKEPLVSKMAWVSVISFSDTAEVLVPLTDLQELTSMPGCTVGEHANYANAFRKLKRVIDDDVKYLLQLEMKVIRPVIFFMSGGEPADDDWHEAHAELINGSGLPFRIQIISFGFGSADGQTIFDVATDFGGYGRPHQAYLAADGFAPEKVFAELLYISSGPISSTARGSVILPMPQPTIDLLIYFVYEDQNHLRGVVQSELDELKNGILNAQARHDILFSVITFADDAEVLLPLTKDPNQPYSFASRKLVKDRPDFGNVFRKIKDVIDSDVTRMKSTGRQILRPVVFFMSECQPVDEEWRADHAALVDRGNPYWPNIITIGVGQADRPSVFEFATDHGAGRARPAHLLADGVTAQTVFQGILDQLPSNVLFQI